ncbi:S8 family peptidase [Paenibacillus campi]|uniref:S8 family peptidase n=1 Tax=Paenibacillus campi TaxID=3106031 RepID=UPI002AFF8C8E|nr:S8 family peptidase [Paenibacillus sp. SGZ-1014]
MKSLNKFKTWKKSTVSAIILIPILSAAFLSVHISNHSSSEQRYLVQYSTIQAKEAIADVSSAHPEFFDYLHMAALNLNEQQKEQLSQTSGVVHIEPSMTYTAAAQAFTPDVKAITVQGQEQASWGYGTVDAQLALQKGYTGKGVKVAILDTGISNHSDLKIAGGVSVVNYTSSYADDNGHGTFVAGIIGAQNNGKGLIGEAPDASLYAVKILDNQGNGSTEQLAQGINWAIQNKMDIVNMSIAFPQASPSVQTMLQTAHDQGILLIAAAGNKGTADVQQDTVQFPAKFSEVMAVAAIDDKLSRPTFSATGVEVDVTAPGDHIVSTASNGKYELRDGTSVAAPFVSGMAAILKQAYPQLTNDQLRSLIEQNTVDLGAPGKDNIYGNGMISFQHLFDQPVAK